VLPAALSASRADAVEVIGTALAAKAAGSGYRTVAALLGRPVATVRRWLRRVAEPHARWLRDQANSAFRLDPDSLGRPRPWLSTLGWGFEHFWSVPHWPTDNAWTSMPPRTLIGLFRRGNLLGPRFAAEKVTRLCSAVPRTRRNRDDDINGRFYVPVSMLTTASP
jgi:hypothetical protein